jgi:hypothetical protein
MTQMTQLEIVGTHAVPFAVHVRPHLSRGDRQRFFRSMRQALTRMGYPMAGSGGMCIAIVPRQQSALRCRDDVLVWLANQREVHKVVLDLPREARSFLRGTLAFADSEGRRFGRTTPNSPTWFGASRSARWHMRARWRPSTPHSSPGTWQVKWPPSPCSIWIRGTKRE